MFATSRPPTTALKCKTHGDKHVFQSYWKGNVHFCAATERLHLPRIGLKVAPQPLLFTPAWCGGAADESALEFALARTRCSTPSVAKQRKRWGILSGCRMQPRLAVIVDTPRLGVI